LEKSWSRECKHTSSGVAMSSIGAHLLLGIQGKISTSRLKLGKIGTIYQGTQGRV
jgi:hypothetical protein